MTFTQRQELAKQVDNWIIDNDVLYCTFAVITYLDTKELIRKKGKWIDLNFNEEMWGEAFECSICGEMMIGTCNYCFNCGADMRGESDDE